LGAILSLYVCSPPSTVLYLQIEEDEISGQPAEPSSEPFYSFASFSILPAAARQNNVGCASAKILSTHPAFSLRENSENLVPIITKSDGG
jgi:hypothetical protein